MVSYREKQKWKKLYMDSASNRMGEWQRAREKYITEIKKSIFKNKYI